MLALNLPIAPEMRRTPSTADGAYADIYSLAKSLWMVLTRQEFGFDGQYDASSDIALHHYMPSYFLGTLDELLNLCTNHNPINRPSLDYFIKALEKWCDVNKDFEIRNGYEWREACERIFPLGTPARAQWTNRQQICDVLNVAASTKGLNHMFYPTGGGMTLLGADLAPEVGMIQLRVSENAYEICCPDYLSFESCEGKPEWSYFRLELKKVHPALHPNSALNILEGSEELTEIEPGVYAPLSAWLEGELDGKPLGSEPRRVTRFSGGSFVIFSTTSTYNRDYSTYDARHNRMTGEEFRQYIHQNAARIG